MGILKSREEYLPVTCAILKDEVRKDFFDALQQRRGGKPDQLAKALGVPVGLVEDWMHGSVNIPLHVLQRLSHEFGLEMPALTELKRELQQVIMTPPPHLPPPPRRPKAEKAKAERAPRAPKERRQPKEPRGQKEPRRRKEPRQQQPRRQKAPKARAPQPQHPKGAKVPRDKNGLPEPCEALAYWTGTVLAAARWEDGKVVFSADRRIGQNYADIWARCTREIFDAALAVSDKDDGKVREAGLEAAALEEFLGRLGFGPKAVPAGSGLPRWAWSNPAWKTACVRGLVDACACFQRQPSLSMTVPPSLARAALKILSGAGFKPRAEGEGTVVIEGKEDVERYIDTVGTDNPKLRDQVLSHLGRRGRGVRPPSEGPSPAGEAPMEEGAPTPAEEAPPEEAPVIGDAAEAPPALSEQAPQPAPAPKPRRRGGPRKTLYHGRPKP